MGGKGAIASWMLWATVSGSRPPYPTGDAEPPPSMLMECGGWRAGVRAFPSSLAWKVKWMVLSDADAASRGVCVCGGGKPDSLIWL